MKSATMTREDILKKLAALMRAIFGDATLAPTASTTSDDLAEWDSANHVLLMVAIEAEFGVRFEPEEITAPQDVGQLVELIAGKLR
jgi:acyl carrier protein